MRLRAVWIGVAWWVASATPAAAFWPFTTSPPPALPDSAVQARVEARYEAFKTGSDASPTAAAPVGGAAAAAAAAAAGVSPGTTISTQAGAAPAPPAPAPVPAAPEVPPPTAAPVAAAVDSAAPAPASFGTAIAGFADSTFAASGDSLAAAGTTPGTGGGPFPGMNLNPPTGMDPSGMNARAALEKGFAPEFSSKFDQSNDNMRASSDLIAGFQDPTGISLRSALNYGADLNLNQDTDTRSTGLINNLNMPLTRHGLNFGISTSNTRMNQEGARNIATSTNNFIDTRSGQATIALSRRLSHLPIGSARRMLRGWSANASYARRVGARVNTTVAVGGTGSGEVRHSDVGNAYGFGVGFDGFKWMTMRGRWGTSDRRNTDRLAITQPELESTSEGDTSSVDVNMPKLWRFSSVAVSLDRSNGNDATPEPARTASGSQSGQVGTYVLENHATVRNSGALTARFAPIKHLDIGVNVNGSRNEDNYLIRRDQINAADRSGMKLDSRLSFWRGATLITNYEWNYGELNQDFFGRRSPNTRTDKGRKLYTELSKRLSRTSLKAYFEAQLDQSYYLNEGPQGFGDRDEWRRRMGGELSSTIADSAVSVLVTAYVRSYNQAFIDARRSSLSRDESEYVVRPSYTWRLSRRVTLRQNYGLASKVIDEVFEPTNGGPTRDTISRNHFMNTGLDFTLSRRAIANVTYDYLLQDNGRYGLVSPTSEERVFAPSQRTKKDFIGVGFRYDLLSGGRLTFVSRQESSRIHNFRFRGATAVPNGVTEQGNLALGFESHLAVSGLTLDCRAQYNRSFNSFLNRDVFYNVDALLKYTF